VPENQVLGWAGQHTEITLNVNSHLGSANPKMRIHKEGRNILFVAAIFLLSIHWILIKRAIIGYRYYAFFAVLSTLWYTWLVYFFRNPRRVISLHTGNVLAPADGKIVAIQEVYEEEYFKANRIQVSVFMSPFNVHVNRSPISGIVKFFKYHPGKHWIAWHPKSSTKNERTTIVIEHGQGTKILLRQIAGLVARRIKCYIGESSPVRQGSEFGFIKFGSRVDVFLPLDTDVKVNLGDKVKGGISVVAIW
jgi:phosphatidylserine decarboxylase